MATISIKDLAIRVHLGVTDRERRKGQKILVSIDAQPEEDYRKIQDSLDHTVDYSSIRKAIQSIMKTAQFKLIETVAARIAHHIYDNYRVKQVTVTIKKFPYRDTKWVGYRLTIPGAD